MRVAFVNTPGEQNADPFRMTPIGSLLLLTILKNELGSDVSPSYIDLRGCKMSEIRQRVSEQSIFLHYCTTPEWEAITQLVALLRQTYPGAVHFAGGPHCGIFPQESQAVFDSICIGEGEGVISQMVRDYMRGHLKKVYRQDTPTNILLNPIPDRSYMPANVIALPGLLSRFKKTALTAAVLFSRGCPFACHFCSNQYRGPIQYRTPQQIEDEIEYLKATYGITAITLKDDNGIPLDPEVAVKNITTIGKTGMMWRAQGRANGIPLHLPQLAADNGCAEVTVAIESVWQPSLDAINKHMDLQRAMPYLRTIKATGMELKILLIVGLPQEPPDIAERTIRFLEEVQPTTVVLSLLCPIPGGQIWKTPEAFGMTINHELPFSKYMSVWGRFDPNEEAPHLFDYAPGYGLPWNAIREAHGKIQGYLRDNNLNH